MRASSPLFQRRFVSPNQLHKWSIRQVTKSNFADSLEDIKAHISDSDFVALSLRRTGSAAAAWHRVSAYDTAETAYSKAKHAAERFQVLQFAVCPFTIRASKVIAHPYNFHLFPRDELKMGMPSYSFSCQTSFLESMVQEGFDFNACIYDGISYLSRVQELAAKVRMGNPILCTHAVKASSGLSVADGVFVGRIKSRIKHWLDSCKDTNRGSDDALISSLRKLIILRSDEYGICASRPCITIDVCSERQTLLVLETLSEISEELLPLIIPAKGGGTQAVRAILASSKEDKNLLERELQDLEDEQSKKLRGFREVMDLISASQKPLVSHNSLNDLTSIHSMFLAPLPPNVNEFLCSLHMVFPQVFDVNTLMKQIVPHAKTTNISYSLSYLNSVTVAPVDIEVSSKGPDNEGNFHGHNIVDICRLFAKLCSVLKHAPNPSGDCDLEALAGYANIHGQSFMSPQDPCNDSTRVWKVNESRVNIEDRVFLWGFRKGITAKALKNQLQGSHHVFSQGFDVRMVDRSCAAVSFWKRGLSKTFLGLINSGEISGLLKDMVSEGLKGVSYDVYERICRQGLWESELADAFDKSLADQNHL